MFFYSLAIYLLTPALLLYILLLSRREPEYRLGWWRRLAIGQERPTVKGRRRIWFHAASVGEVLAVAPIIEQFLSQDGYAVVVTTTTPSGARELRRLFANRVDHAWAPIDAGLVVKGFYKHWRPCLVALVETEIWPNIVGEAKRTGVPVVLVNARMSKRSARGYGKFGCIFRGVFSSLDLVLCHGRADARRLAALGVNSSAIVMVNSVKFEVDVAGRREQGESIARQLAIPPQRNVVVAGSIHPAEQAMLLDAIDLVWRRLPDTLFVIAPRHLPSVEGLAQALADRGIDFALRSQAEQGIANSTQVLVLDTFGELGSVYTLASTAIIGGTLFDRGGHNPLEAIALGVPVIAGHSTFNFSDIYRELTDAGCCHLVDSSASLAAAVERNLTDIQGRQQAASAGLEYVNARAGSARKQMELIASLLSDQSR